MLYNYYTALINANTMYIIHTMSAIKKGSTVWYWDMILKEWRKGTVKGVNRWYLQIHKRHNAYYGYAKYKGYCITCDQAKPTITPDQMAYNKELKRRSNYTRTKSYRLLKRLGFLQ
jgi:hypothetical protein